MGEWVDGCMSKWVNEWMSGWVNEEVGRKKKERWIAFYKAFLIIALTHKK